MVMATRMIWVSLIVLAVFLVGGVLLQIFLSKRESKWPGLVLPAISFLWSLLYLFNLMDTGSMVQNILTALLTMLLPISPRWSCWLSIGRCGKSSASAANWIK